MKIECIKEKLAKALSKVEKMTSKNSTLPVLSCVLFSVKNGKLTIVGTNLDLGIEISLPVKVLEEGEVAVPSSIISNFINNIFEKNITLETKEGNLLVKTEKSNTDSISS
jgi:DNA polymerase-3 subunit beta